MPPDPFEVKGDPRAAELAEREFLLLVSYYTTKKTIFILPSTGDFRPHPLMKLSYLVLKLVDHLLRFGDLLSHQLNHPLAFLP